MAVRPKCEVDHYRRADLTADVPRSRPAAPAAERKFSHHVAIEVASGGVGTRIANGLVSTERLGGRLARSQEGREGQGEASTGFLRFRLYQHLTLRGYKSIQLLARRTQFPSAPAVVSVMGPETHEMKLRQVLVVDDDRDLARSLAGLSRHTGLGLPLPRTARRPSNTTAKTSSTSPSWT